MQTVLNLIEISNVKVSPASVNSVYNNPNTLPFLDFRRHSITSNSSFPTRITHLNMDRRSLVDPSHELPGFATLMDSVRGAWKRQHNTGGCLPPTVSLINQQSQMHTVQLPPSLCCRDDILSASSSGSTDIAHRRQESPLSSTDGLQSQIVPSPAAGYSTQKVSKTCHSLARTSKDSFSIVKSSSTRPKRPGYWDTVLSPSIISATHDENLTPDGSVGRVGNVVESNRRASDDLSQEKPYVCSVCDARFRKRCNLMTHISNVHDKIKPYYCPLCMRRFARKSNCGKHMRVVHRLPQDRIHVLKVQDTA